MAGLWYRLGTVTLTNGSKRVTGVGTTWNNAATGPIPGNTFWGPDYKPYEVERIISDLELDIVEPYTGATVSGAAYKIDTTRKGTVPALASQVTATLSYAQGQYANMSNWAASDLPADVPIILPDGVAIKNVPNLAKMNASIDAKLGSTPQLAALNVPSTVFGRARLNDGDAAAMLAALNSYSRATVVGAVSQAGGANTGAIVELGSNANGSFIKYAGGGLEALAAVDVSNFAVNSPTGAIYQSSSEIYVPLPAVFVGGCRPYVLVRYTSGGTRPWASLTNLSTNSLFFVLHSPQAMTAFSGQLLVGAIGRWY